MPEEPTARLTVSTSLLGYVTRCVMVPFGVKPAPLLLNDVTPMVPVDGVTAMTGETLVTATVTGVDIEPLKFTSPP